MTTTATTTVMVLGAPRAVDRALTATVDRAVVAVAAIVVDRAVVAVAAPGVGLAPAVVAAKAAVVRVARHATVPAVQDQLGLAGAMAPVAIGEIGEIGVPPLPPCSAMRRWLTCVPNRSPWPSS